MQKQNTRWSHTAFTTGLLGMALLVVAVGCGRSEAPSPDTVAPPEAGTDVHIPAPDVPDGAPVAAETYRLLDGSILSQARLVPLGAGIVLQAEGIRITESDLASAIKQAPQVLQKQLEKNLVLVLEQEATDALLRSAAGVDAAEADSQAMHQFIDEIVAGATVTGEEVKAFFAGNREMIGDVALEQVSERIRQHLLGQKREALFMEYLARMGQTQVIGVSTGWLKIHVAKALDNPVDQARDRGLPVMVSFGADSCVPCQMMKPLRESIAEKYTGQMEVVYVHVDRDPVLAQRYGVRGIPFTVFFDASGEKVHEQTGLMTEEQVEEWLEKSGVAL